MPGLQVGVAYSFCSSPRSQCGLQKAHVFSPASRLTVSPACPILNSTPWGLPGL